jgi:hypothetical protein
MALSFAAACPAGPDPPQLESPMVADTEPTPARPHWMEVRDFTHALRDAPEGNPPLLERPVQPGAALSGTGYCVYETYFSEASDPRGLVIAVHRPGSNLGEYASIATRLLDEGFHVMLVDIRTGAPGFGRRNVAAELAGHAGAGGDPAGDVMTCAYSPKGYASRGPGGEARPSMPPRPRILWVHGDATHARGRFSSFDGLVLLDGGPMRREPWPRDGADPDETSREIVRGPPPDADPAAGDPARLDAASWEAISSYLVAVRVAEE